jgi:hypothetical protein
MSKEYEEYWKYFKKDEGNQSALCQICFKSMQCKAWRTVGLHRQNEHIHGMKSTKIFWK